MTRSASWVAYFYEFKKKMKFDYTMFVDISEEENEDGARVYNIVSRNDIEV